MDTRFFRHHRFPGLPVLAVSALAALLLAACTPEEIVYSPANESNTGLRTITLSASCEASATKAAIADDLSFNWSVGDSIAVWAVGETGGAFYNSAPYVSGNQFSVSLAGTRSGYAVYPALAADGVHASETDLYVTLPASYDLSEVSDADWSPLPMIALNQEGEDLHFKHVGGLLRLTVGDMTAATTKIEVDLGHRITGSFQVADAANPGGATCVITTDDDASGQTYVTFTGFTVTAGRTVLNLPVPTGAYTEITVRKFAGDDDPSPETFTFPSSEFSWDLERAHGKKLLAFPVVWSVMGDFNEWSADLDMTETAPGIWESPVFETRPMTGGNGFKFRKNHDYAKGEYWGEFSVYGEAFNALTGSGNIDIGDYTYQNYRVSAKLDLSDQDNPKITVYDHNIWSICGSFDGWTNDVDMEKTGAYLFKGTLTAIEPGTKFKIRKNRNWNYNWGTDHPETHLLPGVELSLISNAADIEIEEDGTYQVELNLEGTMTVTLIKQP